MARIHYYVHGRGRGHATRTLPAALMLRDDGHEVTIFAGEDAFPILEAIGGCHAVRAILPSYGLGVASLIVERTREARQAFRAHGTDLVISDGDLPSLIAAKAARFPSIAVGHAEIFSHCHRPHGVPKGPWRREAMRAYASAPSCSAHVAVNFLNLEPRDRKTVVVRPTIDERLERKSPGDHILCYFRDDNGDALLEALVDRGQNPILFSNHPPKIDGIDARPLDREGFARELSRARAVVATAGSQLVTECVFLGVPHFAVHATDDDEQCVNVAMLKSAGIGTGCAVDDFRPAMLDGFLAGLDKERLSAEQLAPKQEVSESLRRLARELTTSV